MTRRMSGKGNEPTNEESLISITYRDVLKSNTESFKTNRFNMRLQHHEIKYTGEYVKECKHF
jgi:hypothetical protein